MWASFSSPFTRSLKIDLRGSQIIERLVGPLMVVEIEVIINSPSSFRDTLIIPDVDLFILERAPQSFSKDVVHTPSPTVHADVDHLSFEHAREGGAGKLGALVGIEDSRGTGHKSFLQGHQAETSLHRDRGLPGEDIPAEPVHDRHQVEPAAVKPDVRDIRRPNLIRLRYIQPSEQIGVNGMTCTGPA